MAWYMAAGMRPSLAKEIDMRSTTLILCGLLFAAILVFRSRTSLDFIYFQF